MPVTGERERERERELHIMQYRTCVHSHLARYLDHKVADAGKTHFFSKRRELRIGWTQTL